MPTPSSATQGFFQPLPTIPPQGDPALARLLNLYLPFPLPKEIDDDLTRFASLVLSPHILSLTRNAETHPPTLRPLNTFGSPNEIDPLRTSEGWRRLQEIGISEGVVGLGYDCPEQDGKSRVNRRIYQFAKLHLWQGSAALVTCPSAMTDGAAVLLGVHAEENEVFREARRRLISRDPKEAWTSGQWMTERSGGSDVRGTETVAVRGDGGHWSVSGFKWFSSATDADMAVLLAQTDKGLSAFYAPMRRGDGKMNGVRIVRLKEKMGTKSLPTAELELKGMRAWLVGREGEGVKEISRILNITRLHTAIAQVGYWGRGLAVSKAWAGVRRVSGGMLLGENRQHVRWMAGEMVKFRAAMALVFAGVALLGASEQGQSVVEETWAGKYGVIPDEREQVELLLRILTPLMKAQTSLASIAGLRACMESLGGVGYLENNDDIVMNIARLYRDANVGAIWEGTTSVLAEDLVRVLKGKNGLFAMSGIKAWIARLMAHRLSIFEKECTAIRQAWDRFEHIIQTKEVHELHWMGRDILDRLEALLCGCLLMVDAARDGDAVAEAVAQRWTRSRLDLHDDEGDWKTQVEMDRRIFLGDGPVSASKL